MRGDLCEKLGSWKNYKTRLLVASTVIFLFISHFYINWTYSGSFINHEYVGYYVEWYNNLENHHLFTGALQFNFHIGVPFFLKPVFDIFGTSPNLIKTIASGFMAVSTAILFLTYRLKYGVERGLLTVLILFLLVIWHTFSYNEWPIVLFTISVLLYMFVRWYEKREEVFLYLIAVFSGFAFYIKWSYLHVFLALFLSVLITDRKRVKEELEPRKIFFCGIFFLIGVIPLLLTMYGADFTHLNRIDLDRNNSSMVESFIEISQDRFNDIDNRILSPVHPLLELKFMPVGIFSLLLGYGILYSLIKGERIYTLSFLLVLLMLYYTPHGLNAGQLIVLMPFIPIIIGYNIDLIPEFEYRNKLVLTFVLMLWVLSLPYLNSVNAIDNPLHLELDEYEEFTEIEKNERIATNFIHPRLLGQLDQSVSYIYLLGMPQHKNYESLNKDQVDNLNDSDITFILKKTCGKARFEHLKAEDPRVCGYSGSKIIEEIDEKDRNVERIEIGRFEYLLLS